MLLNKKLLNFHSNLMQRFTVDLKTFLGLAMSKINILCMGEILGPGTLELCDFYL